KEYSPAEREAMGFQEEGSTDSIWSVFRYIKEMPFTMRQLGVVQFFSWFALFSMWVFSTPAIAHHVYGLPMDDHSSPEFQNAANWVGIIFGVYSAVSAIYAIFLPRIAKAIGNKLGFHFSYALCDLSRFYSDVQNGRLYGNFQLLHHTSSNRQWYYRWFISETRVWWKRYLCDCGSWIFLYRWICQCALD
ncbi:MAG: hypothetical protein RLZZ197_1812, partial [Bacteroidota bacterium]